MTKIVGPAISAPHGGTIANGSTQTARAMTPNPAGLGLLEAVRLMRRLEPRIMLDGAAVATIDAATPPQPDAPATDAHSVDATADGGHGQDVPETEAIDLTGLDLATAPDLIGQHASVIFIDSRVADPGALLAAAGEDAAIIILDASRDAVAQMLAAVAGHDDLASIHILSHGGAGVLQLGNADFDAAGLAARSADFARLGAALGEGGDILLYGCNVGAGDNGAAFVQLFADITGADVAASTDDTGSASMNGDWQLELHTGMIEAPPLSAPEWQGLMAPMTISVSAAPVTNGLTGTGAVGLWTNAGSIGGTSIDIRATVTSATAGTVVNFATAFGVDAYGPGRDADDMWVQVTGGTAVIRWEVFAAGTGQTIVAFGDPNFRISDIDGNAALNTPFPGLEVEAVSPSLNGLTSYVLDQPTNLLAGVNGSVLSVVGTANQNAESNSLVAFNWTGVSSWDVTYFAQTGFGTRFYFHDGDGDFTFVSPTTTSMLGIDLDADNSTATGTAYQATFTENGSAIPVVDSDLVISQHAALGTDIHSASVRLINAQAGDELLIAGSTAPSGTINGLGYTMMNAGGMITIAFTGTATPADYQAVLQAITFRTNGEAPSGIDRHVEISVTNATFGTTSNLALATLHVTPVNDAPVAADDTGAGAEDTPIVVDVLGNDGDVDNALDPASVVIVTTPPGATLAGDGRTLTVPGEGVWTVNPATGAITFTPEENYNGTPTPIGYRVSDVSGAPSGTATVSVTVTPVSDAPLVDLNSAATLGDGSRDTAVVFVEGAAPVSIAAAGGVSDLGEGDVVSVQLAVSGVLDGASEAITVAGLTLDVGAGTTQVVNVGGVDLALSYAPTGAGAGVLVATRVGGGVIAPAVLDALVQTMTYANTSDAPGVGERTVTVTATDAGGLVSGPAVARITVTPVNDAPVAADDTGAGAEDTPIVVDVLNGLLVNDTDPESDPLQVSTFTVDGDPMLYAAGETAEIPGVGSLIVQPDGSYRFDPAPDFNGQVPLVTYTVVDDQGGRDDGELRLVVTAVNDAPVLDLDAGTPGSGFDTTFVENGDPIAIVAPGVAVGDVDDGELEQATVVLTNAQPGDVLSIAGALPAGLDVAIDTSVPGEIAVRITGTASPADYAAAIAAVRFENTSEDPRPIDRVLTLTVDDGDGPSIAAQSIVHVVPVNDPPVAVDDMQLLGEDDGEQAGSVITGPGADVDAESHPLEVVAATQAGTIIQIGVPFETVGGGVLTLRADGSYTFDPGRAYNGLANGESITETIAYTISDGHGGTTTATLAITIAGANDTPVVVDPAHAGTPDNPTPAVDPLDVVPQAVATDGTPLTPIDVSTFVVDPEGAALTFSVDPATPAWIAIDPVTGIVTGTPPSNASQLTNSGTPGVYVVIVTATDPAGATVATHLTFTVANPAPVAADDPATGDEDHVLIGNVLDNDHDAAPDADPLSVVALAGGTVGAPLELTYGQLVVAADGGYTFTPNAASAALGEGEMRTEDVVYTVSDGNGGTATAHITITIEGRNDAPIVLDPAHPGLPGDPAAVIPPQGGIDGTDVTPLDVGTVFVDPDAPDDLVFTAIGLPPGLGIDPATGIISGTLDRSASQGGPYHVVVTATDPNGGDTSVSFAWVPLNPPPQAEDDVAVGDEDAVITGSVAGNDHDPNSEVLIYDLLEQPAHGTLVLQPDGSFSYVPDADFNGIDSFTYRVSDGDGATDTAIVRLEVGAVNDAPTIAGPTELEGLQNTGFPGDRLDIVDLAVGDIDSATLPIQVTLVAEHGTLDIASVPGVIVETNDGGRELVLTGTPADINLALETLGYLGDFGFNGVDHLPVTVDDLGNVGSGVPLTAEHVVEITLAEVSNTNISMTPPAVFTAPIPPPARVDPTSFQDAIPTTPGGIEITYPNNTFIHFVVTDADDKIDVQYGAGQGGVYIAPTLREVTNPGLDNAGLFDQQSNPTLGGGLDLDEARDRQSPDSGERQGFVDPTRLPVTDDALQAQIQLGAAGVWPAIAENLEWLDLGPATTGGAVAFDAVLARHQGLFDRAARQWAIDAGAAA